LIAVVHSNEGQAL